MQRSAQILAFVVPALLGTPLAAQVPVTRFDRISIENGLSHSSVYAIRQDDLGFIWAATPNGLNRYDGYRLEVYRHDPDDPASLAGNFIFDMLVDRGGDLWLATRGGGLDRFDRAQQRFEHFRHDPLDPASLSDDGVLSVLEDRAGAIWAGTENGLVRWDRERGTFARYLPDPSDPAALRGPAVTALCQDGAGDLWVGTNRGLHRFDRDTGGFVHHPHRPDDPSSLEHSIVPSLAEDAAGVLWVGTDRGLGRFDRAAGIVRALEPAVDGLKGSWIFALHAGGDGGLWVGTDGRGLFRLDLGTGEAVSYLHDPADPESLAGNSVREVFEDTTGILWLGTQAGISKHVPARRQFATYRHQAGRPGTLSGSNVLALHEDRTGVLWVGTRNNGLNAVDRDRGTVRRHPADPDDPARLPQSTVSAICEDRAGDIWVGTRDGLSRFAPSRDRVARHYRHDPEDPHSLRADLVQSLHEDRSGRLWVGTVAGLDRLDRESGRFFHFPDPDDPESPSTDQIYAFHEDRSGDLWLASFDGGGLYRLRRHGAAGSERFERYRHRPEDRDSPAGNQVVALHEDRRGNLWIGTFGTGLDRLDPERRRFRHYRERDGLASDTVVGILEDGRGRLWLATFQGLSRLDPVSETFTNFTVDDGLQSDIFAFRSAVRARNGEMFFGGPNGLTAFFPERIETDAVAPVVAMTHFYLDHEKAPLRRVDPRSPLAESILEARDLVLDHRYGVFAFEFAALHYRSPRRVRYAYRLEGFDPDWIAARADGRLAKYTNLDPGDYLFRVRAANAHGVWNDEGASVRLTVLPPPWRTWWAYSLYALSFVSAVASYLRGQQAKLARERRAAERERLVAERLREADRLKDEFLAERGLLVAEQKRLIGELEARNAELARFNYTVSHDLKSPLVTIMNFLGLLRRDAAAGHGERLEHDLDRLEAAAGEMHRMLEELFEFSRVGFQANPPEEVALGELVREALDDLSGRIAERRAEVDVEAGLPVVSGDRARLFQLVRQLLENAVEHGGDVDRPRIEIGAFDAGAETVVFVGDNGPGVEPRFHEKIFGLFERLEPRGSGGTGIGLALAKRVVEVHGGRIWIESEGRGSGSRFCFTL